jgi:hypothetical protein
MPSTNLRGKALYRAMSAVCGVVSPFHPHTFPSAPLQLHIPKPPALTMTTKQSFMMFGYDAGVLAGVQSTEPFLSAIGHPERDSAIIIPMIASSYTLGAWIMSMLISFIGSPMGRRNCILAGNLCVLVGGTLQAATFSVAQIIVGRVICVSYDRMHWRAMETMLTQTSC